MEQLFICTNAYHCNKKCYHRLPHARDLGSRCKEPCNYRCVYWGQAEVNHVIVSKLCKQVKEEPKARGGSVVML